MINKFPFNPSEQGENDPAKYCAKEDDIDEELTGSPAAGMVTLMHVISISLCLVPANNDPISYLNFTQTVQTGSNYSHRLKASTTPARSKFDSQRELSAFYEFAFRLYTIS